MNPILSEEALGIEGFHRVKKGETFEAIASRYSISVDALAALNLHVNDREVKPGWILKFKK